jgi:hypothetical protein
MASSPIYHPVPARGAARKKVAARLKLLSKNVGTRWTLAGKTLTAASACR